MDTESIRAKYEFLAPVFTERTRRLWAAAEAKSLGHGGIAAVELATGISRSTITRGIRELESGEMPDASRMRRPGGGRKLAIDKDITLLVDLEALLEATTAGMPDAPLRWTSKSTRKLAAELQAMGHRASHSLVADLLHELGYTLQANRKSREGAQHPDRDAQFHYLNEQIQQAQQRGEPAISVDTKKKELVGDFKNPGREWRPKGTPERVRVHDFIIPEKEQGHPLRGLRPYPGRRLGQRRHRS